MAVTIDQLEIQIQAESSKAMSAIDALAQKLQGLQAALGPLAGTNVRVSNSFNTTTQNINKTATATDKYKGKVDKASKSTKSFTDKLAQKISKMRTLYGAFRSVARMMGNWFNESNEYIETLNLFNVTMGDGADAATEYAQSVQKLIGIDIKDWMQYQGVFKNLTAGFGVSSDAANVMSQNLTQLSYDMASFFNTDVETAFDKLSSAMSGQVKGLREFGIDTSVASLQEYALSKGIETSVRSMSQAEKSLLRYNYIMEKSVLMQGDMARTLVTPANSLRILNAQLTQMKRAFGNIISVIATRLIPYVQAFVELITEAANRLADLWGFELPEIDYSGLGSGFSDAEEDAEGVEDSLKKIKKQLMGFDELNIISSPENSASVDTGVSSGALGGMEPLEYDFLKGLDTSKLEDVKEKVKDIAKWAGTAAAAFAGWKISASFLGLGTAFSSFFSALGKKEGVGAAALSLATKFKQAFGAGLMAGGAAIDINAAIEGWSDGVSWEGLGDQLKGAGLLHLGGFLLGGTTGMGFGAMLDGVLTLLPSVKSAIADGNKEWSNTLSIVKGIATLFGGLSVLTGNWIPIAIGGVITVIALIVIYFEDIIEWFKSVFKAIGGWFKSVFKAIGNFFVSLWDGIKSVFKAIGNFFVSLWDGIKSVWNTVATWFNEKVIQPIVNFFAPIVEWISTFFYGCWLIIQATWVIVATWFNDYVIQPIVRAFRWLWDTVSGIFVFLWEGIKFVWNTVATWFNDYVIQPIVRAFQWMWDTVSGIFVFLWEGIKSSWEIVATWFNDKVITPVKNAWDKACTAIGKFFTKLWNGIKKGVVDAMNGVITAIESVVNWIIRAINKLVGGFNIVVKWAASVLGKEWGGLSKISEISIKRISYFADGGFPDAGEMFIAREAGPELVGSIGKKTAVANNDQIVSGIEAGVYRAVMAANSTNKGGSQTIRIINEIDGDVVGEKVIQYHNGRVVQTGVSPLLV